MIARLWHGAVPVAKSDTYLQRMLEIAIPDYRSIPGNRGAYCLHRIDGALAHFEMLTFWSDVEAIKRFAGEAIERAYYYDFDDDFLIEKEPFVRHFTLHGA